MRMRGREGVVQGSAHLDYPRIGVWHCQVSHQMSKDERFLDEPSGKVERNKSRWDTPSWYNHKIV